MLSVPAGPTAYQQEWIKNPQAVAADFAVAASFGKAGKPVTTLEAGKPTELLVNVEVKAAAEYVLIEVPIPAGCSYNGKPQPKTGSEVHREYFKHKVSIFCRALPKGRHQFSIPLLPRYSGSYHLNPARAALMYFPVLYGREELKKVAIE